MSKINPNLTRLVKLRYGNYSKLASSMQVSRASLYLYFYDLRRVRVLTLERLANRLKVSPEKLREITSPDYTYESFLKDFPEYLSKSN